VFVILHSFSQIQYRNVVTGVATHMRSRLLRKISAFKESTMKQRIVTEYKDKNEVGNNLDKRKLF
jgi:hypothetical protein